METDSERTQPMGPLPGLPPNWAHDHEPVRKGWAKWSIVIYLALVTAVIVGVTIALNYR